MTHKSKFTLTLTLITLCTPMMHGMFYQTLIRRNSNLCRLNMITRYAKVIKQHGELCTVLANLANATSKQRIDYQKLLKSIHDSKSIDDSYSDSLTYLRSNLNAQQTSFNENKETLLALTAGFAKLSTEIKIIEEEINKQEEHRLLAKHFEKLSTEITSLREKIQKLEEEKYAGSIL